MNVSIKLSFHELLIFSGQVHNIVSVLSAQQDQLERLGGLVLQRLYNKLQQRTAFEFYGDRKISFSEQEALSLNYGLYAICPQEGEYERLVRKKIYTIIERKLKPVVFIEEAVHFERPKVIEKLIELHNLNKQLL